MAHRGVRSREAVDRRFTRRQSRVGHIKRTAAKIVRINSERDRRKAESINLLTPEQIIHQLIDELPEYKTSDLIRYGDHFVDGEVISDSRGQGTQQGEKYEEA